MHIYQHGHNIRIWNKIYILVQFNDIHTNCDVLMMHGRSKQLDECQYVRSRMCLVLLVKNM